MTIIAAVPSVFLLAVGASTLRPEATPPDAVSYSHRIWQSTDGLPEDLAQAVVQTPDSYLWIGTSGGLVRFDGVRFTVFNHENTPAFRDDSVYSLFVSKDGTLWAGTEGGGLIRCSDGVFRRFGADEGLMNGFVRAVFEDGRGRLWVGTDAGLFRMQDATLVRIDGKDGLPAMNVHSIREDHEGRLLVGGWGLLVLDGKRAQYYTSGENLADNSIRTICPTSDGSVWIGTISGLRRLEHGVRGNPFDAPRILSGLNIAVLLESRRNELWIGSYGQGVMRFQGGRISRFAAPASIPHNNVLSLFEDGEDNVWIGTQGGLLRLSPCGASTITTADGAPVSINTIYQDPSGALLVAALNGRLFRVADQTLEPMVLPAGMSRLRIRNVFRDSRGALWIGTDGQGAARIVGKRVYRYTMKQGLVNDFVRAFCEDHEGGVWIGTDGGLSRWRSGGFDNYTTASGLTYGSIRCLLLDRKRRLWVATERGVSRYESGAFVADPTLESLRSSKVWALHEDSDGNLWIGTQGAGLFQHKDGRLFQYTTKQGLPSDKIHFITEDDHHNLWMSGPSGIVSIARRDLEALPENPSGQIAMRLYTTAEGLRTNQMNGGVQSAGVLTSNGELWFPSTKGAVRVAPAIRDRVLPLPVVIEQAIADDRPVEIGSGVSLSPGNGKLEIHYSAIRLRAPERIRFKYFMEGFDHGWTFAGQRRVAYYTNLPPGRYLFRVVAYEMNAPHYASEQALLIEWKPHFYQTWWFLALCAALAGSAALGSYRLHVRNIRRRFAAVLDERNRLAREMHDTLIQGCVGVSTLLEAASRAQDVSPSLTNELLDRARTEIRGTVDEARNAVWDLRHGSESGEELLSDVSRLVNRVGQETGIAAGFESSGSPFSVDAEAKRGLMMVIREALQNATRHAAPKRISCRLRFERRGLGVEIEDDGCGFDPSEGGTESGQHYGLIGMRERVERLGGKFTIESSLGCGTKVRLSIPIARPFGEIARS